MSSKTGIKALATGRSDLYRLAPSDIHVKDGWNARDIADPSNVEHIEMLATSIAAIGVRQPLRVYWRDGQAFVSDGHCRLAAVKLAIERGADIKDIPVVTENQHSSEADHMLTMIVGNAGKPLSAVETARVLKQLSDFGWTTAEIANKVGRSTTYVTNLLELNAAPQPVLDMVTRHLVSASQASATIRKEGVTKATETLEKAVETAKAAGKQKATARDIGGTATGKTFKTEVRDIFARSKPDPKTSSWFFSHADFVRLQELM